MLTVRRELLACLLATALAWRDEQDWKSRSPIEKHREEIEALDKIVKEASGLLGLQ